MGLRNSFRVQYDLFVCERDSVTLGPFPIDDITLNALEHAMGGALTVVDGEPELVGAEYSVNDLLDFLSGYDPSLLIPDEDNDVYSIPVFVYDGPIYHITDVVRSLINEVRSLRNIENVLDKDLSEE